MSNAQIGYHESVTMSKGRTLTHITGVGGPICGAKPGGMFQRVAAAGSRDSVERHVECKSCLRLVETPLLRHLVGE